MTHTSTDDRTAGGTKRSGAWTGWITFGAAMLILLGLFHAIQGIVAVADSKYYLVTSSGLVVSANYTVWGWVHIGLGVLAVLAGIGVLAGNAAARVAAVVLAGLSAIVNLGFIAAYPFWSIVVIALDVIVIYAIVTHGRDMEITA